jgi:hypothetical protein
LGYQNRLAGNAPQAQAFDVTKSSVRDADDTLNVNNKSKKLKTNTFKSSNLVHPILDEE